MLGFEPQWVPYLLAAPFMLGLSVWLLWLDAGSLSNRVFALILFLRALWMGTTPMRVTTADPAIADYLLRVLPYLIIPLVPLMVLFASLYPRRRGIARRPWGVPALVAAIVVAEVAYAYDHALVWTYARSDALGGYASAAPGASLVYTGFGPLVLLVAAQQVASAMIGLVFARDAVRTTGSRRTSALLVCAGFTLNALFDGANLLAALGNLLAGGEAFPWWPWGWAFALLPQLTIVPALAAPALLAWRARTDPTLRPGAVRLAAASALPVASAAALALGGAEATYLSVPVASLLIGLWRLSLPILVTYALVRHQLFDIDVKVRWTLKASTVAVVFLAVFFTVSEIAGNLVQERLGSALGVAAAVALAFALKPVERLAEDLAHRVMPGTRDPAALRGDDRLAFYLEQAALAWQDGSVGTKERQMLERLRARLGLDPEVAARLDAEGARLAVA